MNNGRIYCKTDNDEGHKRENVEGEGGEPCLEHSEVAIFSCSLKSEGNGKEGDDYNREDISEVVTGGRRRGVVKEGGR